LAKLKPLLMEYRDGLSTKLSAQETGEFLMLRDAAATHVRAGLSLLLPGQLPDHEILSLARRSGHAEASNSDAGARGVVT
jgi:hypothetical protein